MSSFSARADSQASSEAQGQSLLVCRVGAARVAIPIAHVRETMRPLRIEPLPGAPAFVLGVAIIRGATVPVLDANQLLGSPPGHDFERFVTLRVRERLVALAVRGVLGVCTLSNEIDAPLPPLLRDATAAAVQALRVLDHELLWVLESANVLPEPLLAKLDGLTRSP